MLFLALASIVHRKLEEARALNEEHADVASSDLRRRLQFMSTGSSLVFSRTIRRGEGKISVIGDMKRHSPSHRTETEFEALGFSRSLDVDALSVCVDSAWGGSMKDLRAVAHEKPCLCKDVVVDPIQIALAAEAGASSVLLIATVLGARLRDLLDYATVMGVETAVEVHTENECAFALAAGATTLICTNRDRTDNELHQGQALGLKSDIPGNIVTIAASGISSLSDIQQYAQAGFDGVMLGRRLLQDPKDFLREARNLQIAPPALVAPF